MNPINRTGANIIEVGKKEKQTEGYMENNNWQLGSALETHINLLQKLGTDGVESELTRIREATFARMRNHENQSISWERILQAIENGKKNRQ